MDITGYDKSSRIDAAAKEAYKALRTNIRFSEKINGIKTISITSCIQGEGKTTTAVNLAKSMADSGMKTLLADVDFRKPMIDKVFGLKLKAGLTSYIVGEVTIEEIVYGTGVDNLFVIPCGVIPPNPAELLSSERFSAFVKDIGHKHLEIMGGQPDIVIFDTPPLGSVIDAAIVAALTDGTILVIKPKSTNYKLACQVKEQLEKANAALLGVVINKVRKKDLKYGYYSYYYNYDYYYATDNKKPGNPLRKIMGKIKLCS
ncbi:MAG: CpsD/CapB family tyrosine-protein kinase [Clostridiaceae bacterium]|nr:CpsD/CapB family tyrosine-protein kinase [Clostridiaceae bacterium]